MTCLSTHACYIRSATYYRRMRIRSRDPHVRLRRNSTSLSLSSFPLHVCISSLPFFSTPFYPSPFPPLALFTPPLFLSSFLSFLEPRTLQSAFLSYSLSMSLFLFLFLTLFRFTHGLTLHLPHPSLILPYPAFSTRGARRTAQSEIHSPPLIRSVR
jgi:hypothetical protein